jgi:hypothetical protein
MEIASAAEGVTKSSVADPESSKGRPMDPNDRAKIMSKPSKGPKRRKESLIGDIEPKVVGDEVTVKRVDALNSNFPKRAGENAIIGPGTPG